MQRMVSAGIGTEAQQSNACTHGSKTGEPYHDTTLQQNHHPNLPKIHLIFSVGTGSWCSVCVPLLASDPAVGDGDNEKGVGLPLPDDAADVDDNRETEAETPAQ